MGLATGWELKVFHNPFPAQTLSRCAFQGWCLGRPFVSDPLCSSSSSLEQIRITWGSWVRGSAIYLWVAERHRPDEGFHHHITPEVA